MKIASGDDIKMAKKVKVALIYDFDGTLSTTDMQNYGLIPTFGMSCKLSGTRPTLSATRT